MFIPLLLGMIVGVALVLVIVTARSRRQARQSTLLWLLAIAAERGRPLPEEIEALSETASGPLYQDLRQLAGNLRLGDPLPVALERNRTLVPHSAVVASYIGTRTGTLPQVLKDAALRCTAPRPRATSSPLALGGAFLYLWTLLMMAVFIVGFLLYWIVPKFVDIFSDFGVELPDATITLVGVGDSVADFGFLLFPILLIPPALLLAAAILYWKGWEAFDLGWMGRWFIRWDTPGILRGMAHSVAAGAPIVQGLEALRERHHQEHVRNRLERAVQACERGEDCWTALRRQKILRPAELRLVQAAQRAGNLPWALRELADSLEDRRSYRWLAVLEILQPAVVVVIGLGVLFICLAFFLPLVKLIEEIQ